MRPAWSPFGPPAAKAGCESWGSRAPPAGPARMAAPGRAAAQLTGARRGQAQWNLRAAGPAGSEFAGAPAGRERIELRAARRQGGSRAKVLRHGKACRKKAARTPHAMPCGTFPALPGVRGTRSIRAEGGRAPPRGQGGPSLRAIVAAGVRAASHAFSVVMPDLVKESCNVNRTDAAVSCNAWDFARPVPLFSDDHGHAF